MRMRCVVLVLLLCLACTPNEELKQERCPSKLRTCLAADIASFDPRKEVNMMGQGVIRMLFSGLVYLDKYRNIALDLADSYQISDDLKTYTFFLKNCRWSDGSPITARDFEASWKGALTPACASLSTNLFFFIKNAKKAFLGELSLDEVGVRSLDETTLLVKLEEANSQFLKILTSSVFSPVHKSIYDTSKMQEMLVSSGPFLLQQHRYDDKIVIKRNDQYWNNLNTQMEQIEYLIIKDPATALLMFENGEIDWLGGPLMQLPSDSLSLLKEKGICHWPDVAGIQWLIFNTEKFPYRNVHIRKALAYAIDRNKIIRNILNIENFSAPLGLIPAILKREKWHPWFQDHDTAGAQEHFAQGLRELGVTIDTFPTLTLSYPSLSFTWATIAQAIQQMWMETLKISVNVEALDYSTLNAKLLNRDYEMARFGWVMQYDDPSSLFELFKLRDVQPNCTGWENKDYIHHVEASRECCDQERWLHFELAEKVFFDEMPATPLSVATAVYLQQPHVKGVEVNHLFQVDFRSAYVEEASCPTSRRGRNLRKSAATR